MPNIPFKEQILPVDYLSLVQANVQSGKVVSGDELLGAIEQNTPGPLPEDVRRFVRLSTIPAVKARGRPPSFEAARDFALLTVDTYYPRLLRKNQNEARKARAAARAAKISLPKAEASPSEQAYCEILENPEIRAILGNPSWKGLRNMRTRWKKGHFHPAENAVDSVDFEERIEELFPSTKARS